MPAPQFAAVDAAYEQVRNAFAAKADAQSNATAADTALAEAQVRAATANQALPPLRDAYLAAVQVLREAIEALASA